MKTENDIDISLDNPITYIDFCKNLKNKGNKSILRHKQNIIKQIENYEKKYNVRFLNKEILDNNIRAYKLGELKQYNDFENFLELFYEFFKKTWKKNRLRVIIFIIIPALFITIFICTALKK